MMVINRTIAFVLVIVSLSEYCSCQHSCRPVITDLSRLYNFIKWSVPHCSSGLQVQQYRIWFSDTSELHFQTYLTNMTRTHSSCTVTNGSICFFRIRAELNIGLVSSYSPCLNVSNQLNEEKIFIERYQDICFGVNGLCSDGLTLSQYRVNGKLLESGDYNLTQISTSGSVFCLTNVSSMIVVTEWCDFIAESDNQFCLPGVGVLMLLTRTEIYLESESQHSISENVPVNPSVSIKDTIIISTKVNISAPSVDIKHQSVNDSIVNNHDHARITFWISGMLSLLIMLVISIILIVIMCCKRKKKCTEPASPEPEPVYETIQPDNEEGDLEIKQNEAYLSLSKINMTNCPAYTTHRQIKMSRIY